VRATYTFNVWQNTSDKLIDSYLKDAAGNTIYGTSTTAGTITMTDGTGWQNLDLRGTWRPDSNVKSTHQVSFGFHSDTYRTRSDQVRLAAGNWMTSSAAALNTHSRGKTSTDAIYLQDAWQIAPSLKLVLGGRQEKWTASNGSNFASGTNVS
jgi:iron complex outermembrane receptor protein